MDNDPILSMEELQWQIICDMLAKIGMVCNFAMFLHECYDIGYWAWNDNCTIAAVFLVWSNLEGIGIPNGVIFVQFLTSFSFE